MDVVGIGGGSLLVLLIEVPHTPRTHNRSSLYIHTHTHNITYYLLVERYIQKICGGFMMLMINCLLMISDKVALNKKIIDKHPYNLIMY